MKLTTLCYVEKDGKYLMLYRNRKKNDENGGKWIGVGGKFESGETPNECMRRETLEETGLSVKKAQLCGIVTFVSDQWGTEYMHLFTSDSFEFDGLTGENMTWDNTGAVSKSPKGMVINNGAYVGLD